VTPDDTEGPAEEQPHGAPPSEPADDAGLDDAPLDLSQEAVIADLERVTGERDQYLDQLRRTQADFENYRKRMMKQQTDLAEGAATRLVEDLLPVLDACDSAVFHGATEVEPVFAALLGTLEKAGLERFDPVGEPFDPNRHEAVMHEPAADGDEGSVVTDVMRRGYAWKGRVLRAAMVKVRG
jgi:molecular chaperone GrpE